MEIWKLLLITLLSAVVLGCIVGIAVGKHRLKVNSAGYKPLLTTRERLAYTACLLIGAGCVAGGIYLSQRQPAVSADGGELVTDAFMGDMAEGGEYSVIEGAEPYVPPIGADAGNDSAVEALPDGEASSDTDNEAAGLDEEITEEPDWDSESEAGVEAEEKAAATAPAADAPAAYTPRTGTSRRAPIARSGGGQAVIIYG